MKITEIRIKKINTNNRIKGIATVVFDNSLAVHDIRIIKSIKNEDLFIAMPSRKLPNGDFVDISHPINQQLRSLLTDEILKEYKNL
jgi:stage V sporulation protein G